MRIRVELTRAELSEMGVSKDRLRAALYDQLDDAAMSSTGKPAIELSGYDLEIELTDELAEENGDEPASRF